MFKKMLRIVQLPRQQRFLLIFVGIERRDPLFGRTVLFILEPRFFQRVQIPMPRQKEGSPFADLEVFRRNGDARRAERFDLCPQTFEVEGDAAAENVDDVRTEDARRQQMQCEFSELVDDGMPRVSSALIADYVIEPFGQKIDHTTFALITPVDPYDRAI